jgi:ATP-dependent Clp protease protease subunit
MVLICNSTQNIPSEIIGRWNMNASSKFRERFELNLLQRRILYINGEITDQLASDIGAAIVWLNTLSGEPITIYVDSPGGKASAGLDIVDAIKNSTAPVDVII